MSLSDYLVRHYTRNGCTVTLYTDPDAESPDGWGNEDVFLVAFHRDRHRDYRRIVREYASR